MTRTSRTAGAVAVHREDGRRGAGLVTDLFQPVRSRWTWQPLLPELWLREHEGRQFREFVGKRRKEG
jgi:hypothetical protein